MVARRRRALPHRRRREQRTDYRQRLKLLKSGKPRLVVRRFLNSVICQVVSYEPKGDKTLAAASSLELSRMGWRAHGGNLPSAYLTGLLCGLRAKKAKVTEAVLDTGIHASASGSCLYSALKGFLDAGLKVPHSEKILPPEGRISGKHIADYAGKMKKEKPEKYKKHWSRYAKSKLQPEKLPEHFRETKKKVLAKK